MGMLILISNYFTVVLFLTGNKVNNNNNNSIYKERLLIYLRSHVKDLADDCIKTGYKRTNNNKDNNNDDNNGTAFIGGWSLKKVVLVSKKEELFN